jgi:hypothetical protein
MAIEERDAQRVAKDETSTMISSDKVEGTTVYNTRDEKLGSIETVMIDKQSGQVRYAVMSFGGFLGMGEDYHPLPWDVLKYDTRRDGYVVDLDKDRLEKAPHYSGSDASRWTDPQWGRATDEYYAARRM